MTIQLVVRLNSKVILCQYMGHSKAIKLANTRYKAHKYQCQLKGFSGPNKNDIKSPWRLLENPNVIRRIRG